jgi:ABC-type glycerol-3-phosphate transport system permease component
MKRSIKRSFSDHLFYVVDNVALILAGIIILIPLLNVIASSLSAPTEVLAGKVGLWPKKPTLTTFAMLFKSPLIVTGYLNTFFYASVGTVINLIMTVLCAYPLSREKFMGKNFIMLIFAFTMMFGGGMIPTYLLIKNLGLMNTRAVMLIPGAMSVWNMILARTFFQNTIPREMYESAELDGASHFRVLVRIVLPLSAPILAVLTLFYVVGHWNSYFDAMMYLQSRSLFNIQLVLRIAISSVENLFGSDMVSDLANMEQTLALREASKYGIIVISMVPVLVIYPFVQKHFIRGIMIGSIKG